MSIVRSAIARARARPASIAAAVAAVAAIAIAITGSATAIATAIAGILALTVGAAIAAAIAGILALTAVAAIAAAIAGTPGIGVGSLFDGLRGPMEDRVDEHAKIVRTGEDSHRYKGKDQAVLDFSRARTIARKA